MSDSQRILGWSEAGDRLLAAAAGRMGVGRGAVVIGITGPVGSGKSTLASRLGVPLLSTDDYLPDYEQVPYHERDEPRHADLGLLAEHLEALRAGRPVRAPVWSFQTHRRESVRRIEPASVMVCEGIHALAPTVRSQLDISVFVDAPASERWRRWEALELSGERGWGVDVAAKFFAEVAEPSFAKYSAEYRREADFVVLNGG